MWFIMVLEQLNLIFGEDDEKYIYEKNSTTHVFVC